MQLRTIVTELKKSGLFDQYAEEAHGEAILLSIRTRTFEDRELVKQILEDAGITELTCNDESAA